MTDSNPPQPDRVAEARRRLKTLADRFFGVGNDAYDYIRQYPDLYRPFLDRLEVVSDAPVVLPRLVRSDDRFGIYVIALKDADVPYIRELLQAFAGPSFATQGIAAPARLDPSDPVDAAVIEFAQERSTFVVETGKAPHHRVALRQALGLMQQVTMVGPRREWRIPKPLGRLLADFQAALTSGGAPLSESLLEEIAARGGVSATNLAHLRIKRLDRLGLAAELLTMEGLGRVLRQDPPVPVKEAVLNAVYSVHLRSPLEREDVEAAIATLRDAGPINLPLHEDPLKYGDEAVTVLLTAALGRRHPADVDRIWAALGQGGREAAVPVCVAREAAALLLRHPRPAPDARTVPEKATPDTPSADEDAARAKPQSWLELIDLAAAGAIDSKSASTDEIWREWPSPAEYDTQLSQRLGELDDAQWERVWQSLVSPFIEAVGYDRSAPATAMELITYAVSFDKFAPVDLLVLHSLTEIALRSSPPAVAYTELLETLRGTCPQWVSPDKAIEALDFADRLVLAACPEPDARTNLAVALLNPLHQHQRRLDPSMRDFARKLSSELGIAYEWEEAAEPEEKDPLTAIPPVSLLLYSLDERVLSRTKEELERVAPAVKVSVAHEKVGSPSLREKARNAHVVVLATRCATHAATGFIQSYADKDAIRYARGSGSASLVQEAVAGLKTYAQAL
ncbi:hypothetical protein HNR12_003400 [Streptomonospora nanhaiensis]|uniref:Uncharacterized protein n=1 Tax=Streptomonospora nanhaiensis TaxID=1323731 RepID=A0A853BPL9_9ACTN|nr:hypothetical protein [Streptomonospora nanhaiensis]